MYVGRVEWASAGVAHATARLARGTRRGMYRSCSAEAPMLPNRGSAVLTYPVTRFLMRALRAIETDKGSDYEADTRQTQRDQQVYRAA